MKQHSRCPWTGTEAAGGRGRDPAQWGRVRGSRHSSTSAPGGWYLPAGPASLVSPSGPSRSQGTRRGRAGPPSRSPSGVGRRGGAAACGSGRWPSAGEDAEAEQAVGVAPLPPAEPRGWG